MNAPLVNAPLVPVSPSAIRHLPRYTAMREAVAVCATVDEARDIKDKAAALAFYASQRDDREVLVWFQEIKLRASRRIGEILSNIERSRTGRPGPGSRRDREPSLLARAIESSGLRRHTAYELQEIAGPREAKLRALADGAAERYFEDARAAQAPASQEGLKAAVIAAVHAAMGPEEIRRAAKVVHRRIQAAKAAKRSEREIRLGDSTRAASATLGLKLYSVLYADPPWQYEVYSRETGMDRAADNHYPTMPTARICALPVPAAPDSVLLLWATVPMLEDALSVLRSWGFIYKSHYVWNKPRAGTGYWARNKHEILLLGTRGKVPAPSPGTQPASVIDAAMGRHSEKPGDFADVIARMFPTAPKVELFARTTRPGWDVWGNEVEAEGVAA